MTDEKLDQILKQALAPEIDDSEIQIQKKGRAINMSKVTTIMRRNSAAAAAVAILLVGSITVLATVYTHWSRGISAGYQITGEQKEEAQQNGLASNPAQTSNENNVISASDKGITVAVEQTVADENTATLAFQVTGYELADGMTPYFDEIWIELDGETASNWDAGFYNGLTSGTEAFYDDGTPYEYDDQGLLKMHYADETGALEYQINMRNAGLVEGGYVGKEIAVHFRTLGSSDQFTATEQSNLVDGSWDLNWTLEGSEADRHETLDAAIGDTGVTLVAADISPLSFSATVETDRLWEDDFEMEENFPFLCGVMLEEGTQYLLLKNGGTEGYIDKENLLYQMTYQTNRVLDPDKVTAFLFQKNIPITERALTEDDFYVVEISNHE